MFQANGGNSIEGATVDAFYTRGHQHIYLKRRNHSGAGFVFLCGKLYLYIKLT